MSDLILPLLSSLTLASNIALVPIILVLVSRKFPKIKKKIFSISNQKLILIAFLIATSSTLGSLFMSEVAQLPPCKLCWFQRIFMYPLVIIFAVAIIKELKEVAYYALSLSIFGGAIALFQYFLQVSQKEIFTCSLSGSASCTDKLVTHFGYITIPFMSVTAFVLIAIVMIISLKHK